MMGRIAAAAVLTLAAACGSLHRGSGASAQNVRLCVQNGTVGYGNIRARADLVSFDVMPGEEVCKSVPTTGPSLLLQAQTMGGGTAGPLTFATRLQFQTGCWRWRLTGAPGSSADLAPCESSRGPGSR
jgi:hypothetical protein